VVPPSIVLARERRIVIGSCRSAARPVDESEGSIVITAAHPCLTATNVGASPVDLIAAVGQLCRRTLRVHGTVPNIIWLPDPTRGQASSFSRDTKLISDTCSPEVEGLGGAPEFIKDANRLEPPLERTSRIATRSIMQRS